ncbi:GQ67_02123T0 [Komagataella phaffii]|nr:GQ67_02123T0 [Komagataella phaffii]AOA66673.1 GQ68_02138T0 [Komagataella phaffii GS115]
MATCPTNPDILLSGSRDKTLIVWQLNGDDQAYGVPKKALKGHSHIVSDCKLSLDSEFALSSSWDKTVRLWNLKTGEIIKYAGHTSDVLSVDLSQNLRVIASASRDKTIKLWNIVGEEVATLEGHTDWVTSVRFVPGSASDIISASSDKLVKVCFFLLHGFFKLFNFSIPSSFIANSFCSHDVKTILLLQTVIYTG